MKKKLFLLVLTQLVLSGQILKAQSPIPWVYIGNNVTDPSSQFIGTTSTEPFRIRTDDTERMVVDENGNVGIGTMSPGNLLQLYNSGTSASLFAQISNGNSTYTNGLLMGINTSNEGEINMKDSRALHFLTTNATRMTVTSGGNVGIGTTSPNFLLHQDGGNGNATYHQFTNGTTSGTTSTDGFLIGIASSTGNAELKQQENLPMLFFTNGNNERMRIAAEGNVGIGSTTPFCKLHVLNGNSVDVASVLSASLFKNILENEINTTLTILASSVGAAVTSNSSGNEHSIGTVSVAEEDDADFNIGVYAAATAEDSWNVGLFGEAYGSGSTNVGVLGGAAGNGVAVCGFYKQEGSVTVSGGVQAVKANITAVNGATVEHAEVFRAEYNILDIWDDPGSITNAYGLWVEGVPGATGTTGGTGAVGNAYGIYLGSNAGATGAKYGIWQDGASDLNFFRGKVGIGTPTPAHALEVTGTIAAKQILITTDTETKDLLVLIKELRNEVDLLKAELLTIAKN